MTHCILFFNQLCLIHYRYFHHRPVDSYIEPQILRIKLYLISEESLAAIRVQILPTFQDDAHMCDMKSGRRETGAPHATFVCILYAVLSKYTRQMLLERPFGIIDISFLFQQSLDGAALGSERLGPDEIQSRSFGEMYVCVCMDVMWIVDCGSLVYLPHRLRSLVCSIQIAYTRSDKQIFFYFIHFFL